MIKTVRVKRNYRIVTDPKKNNYSLNRTLLQPNIYIEYNNNNTGIYMGTAIDRLLYYIMLTKTLTVPQKHIQ